MENVCPFPHHPAEMLALLESNNNKDNKNVKDNLKKG